jgi:iron complex outermembrane receptor protein
MDAKYVSYANELGNFSGNQVPGIPRILFNGGVRWEAAFGATADFGFEHAGFYFADDANSIWVPSYFILNASLGYWVKFGNLRLESFLGAGNLTDKRYAASGFINPSGSGAARAFLEPGLPRNYFGGLKLHFVP